MEVKVKKLNPNAVIPSRTHNTDFCYDCIAVSEEEIAPNVWKYGLGLSFEIDKYSSLHSVSNYNFCIDARARSSVWKTGMILANCVGTIDQDYRGEVCAIFYHVIPNMPRYKVGDKIVQIKLGRSEKIKFTEVNDLTATERGASGFGSTGK